MKKFIRFNAYFILLFISGVAWPDNKTGKALADTVQTGRTAGQEKALKERGEKITHIKDDLIRRTLRSYGGDYIRSDMMTAIILNGKTYKDFTVEVVQDRYLRIQTPDDTYYMELESELPNR